MSRRAWLKGMVGIGVALACTGAIAGDRPRIDIDLYERGIRAAAGQPNERARWQGLWKYANHRDEAAREDFTRAAYYGDKPSQYFLSLMAAAGEGGARDPVEAYIWADVAAEGGGPPKLLGLRERLWNALTEEQRLRVKEVGPSYYDRFGNVAARPRTNREIMRFLYSKTGSRAGGDTGILGISSGLGRGSPGSSPDAFIYTQDLFYGAGRVRPTAYWARHEAVLGAVVGGRVRAGDLQDAKSKPKPES